MENGVKFMVHPKVKTAPLSQRISFLEGKVTLVFLERKGTSMPYESFNGPSHHLGFTRWMYGLHI